MLEAKASIGTKKAPKEKDIKTEALKSLQPRKLRPRSLRLETEAVTESLQLRKLKPRNLQLRLSPLPKLKLRKPAVKKAS